MFMKTAMDERVRRVLIGVLLILGGYMFVWPLQFLSFFSGLMLFGFAIDPRGTEFPEDDASQARMEAKPSKPAISPKKATRKKKSS